MALVKATLKTALQKIFEDIQRPADDEDAELGKSVWFELDIGSPSDAAGLWAAAVAAYAGGVTQGGTGAADGQAALKSKLTEAFSTMPAQPPAVPPEPPPSFALMEAGFATFALAVGTGMKTPTPPLVPQTATPPPGPVGFASLFTGTAKTPAAAATAISNAIDLWMKTGMAKPDIPPTSTPAPWA